jgi:hypothetical protein
MNNDSKSVRDGWLDFFNGEFRAELMNLPARYPCTSDCVHCHAPMNLRVFLPQHRMSRIRLLAELSEKFLCCWYGLLLVSQGLHKHFPEAHDAWTKQNFCPLPVTESGMGCVQVAPPRSLLRAKQISESTWTGFVPFFENRILGEMESITGIGAVVFMKQMRQDRDFHEENAHPFENLLFSSLAKPEGFHLE